MLQVGLQCKCYRMKRPSLIHDCRFVFSDTLINVLSYLIQLSKIYQYKTSIFWIEFKHFAETILVFEDSPTPVDVRYIISGAVAAVVVVLVAVVVIVIWKRYTI